jgi:hypothetical protein
VISAISSMMKTMPATSPAETAGFQFSLLIIRYPPAGLAMR